MVDDEWFSSGLSRGAMLAAGIVVMAGVAAPALAQTVSFKDDITPILELRCIECHQPGGQGYEANGLDLRTYESVMKGTKFGPVVTPREPVISTLAAAVEWRDVDPELRMPFHRKKLSKCETLMIRHWIQQGARNN